MNGIRSITASSEVPDDLAKRLKPIGVNEILLVLWEGYHDLLSDSKYHITEESEEDAITKEWYGKVYLRWTKENRATLLKMNIGPVHQYPDPTLQKEQGHSPTIDFCFRDWDTTNSYFGVESKNLYDNNKQMVRRYVETGINNYISGRYGANSSESSIVGYVLSGQIPQIVNSLINEILKINPLANLSRELLYKDPQYISCHRRNYDEKDIFLHHLFFDFTNHQ